MPDPLSSSDLLEPVSTLHLVVYDPEIPDNDQVNRIVLGGPQLGAVIAEAIDAALEQTDWRTGGGGEVPEDVATEAYVDAQLQVIIDALAGITAP